MSDKDFFWDFAFIPNAQTHGPHLGHLWILAHLRLFHQQMVAAQDWNGWPQVTFRFGLIFEERAVEPWISQYIKLLEWLGWGPDFDWRLDDWAPPPHDRAKKAGTPLNAYACHSPSKFLAGDHTLYGAGKGLKLFAMQSCPIHVRAFDEQVCWPEEISTCCRNNLRMPEVRQVPVLRDESGAKIGGQAVDESYQIMPLITNCRDPRYVLVRLYMAAGGPVSVVVDGEEWRPFNNFWAGSQHLVNYAVFRTPLDTHIKIKKDWLNG